MNGFFPGFEGKKPHCIEYLNNELFTKTYVIKIDSKGVIYVPDIVVSFEI